MSKTPSTNFQAALAEFNRIAYPDYEGSTYSEPEAFEDQFFVQVSSPPHGSTLTGFAPTPEAATERAAFQQLSFWREWDAKGGSDIDWALLEKIAGAPITHEKEESEGEA